MRFIYYDTETTGLSFTLDRIVELAAFDPENNKTFVSLINPGIPIPLEASKIHNISDEMVKDAPSFKEVMENFIQFCGVDVVLVAHNGDSFDLPFLKSECTRHATPFPFEQSLDSLKWARRYRKDLPKHQLQILREIYGISANQAHRALDDVFVLHQIFSLMTDDLSKEEIYHLMNQPKEIQHMPFGKHQGIPLKEVPRAYVEWLHSSGALAKPENKELKESFQKIGILAAVS